MLSPENIFHEKNVNFIVEHKKTASENTISVILMAPVRTRLIF